MDWLHEDDVDDTEIDLDFTTELPYVESFDVMNENKLFMCEAIVRVLGLKSYA